jgi:hypothetical protein
MGAGAAVGNVVGTIVNGDWRGSASRSVDVTPTAAPSGNGVSRLSPQALTQNQGGLNELARPPRTSLFDPARGALAQSVPGAEGGPGSDVRSDGTGGSARAAPAAAIPLSAPVVDEALAALGRALRAAATVGVEDLIELTAPFSMDSDAAPYQASANQMNQEVKRGQAPREVKRVDNAHPPEDPQDHAHLEDGSRVRKDGTTNPEGANIPQSVIKWLRGHGWNF